MKNNISASQILSAHIFIFLLIGIILTAGCAAEQISTGAPEIKNTLPSVDGWEMNKAEAESPEGLQIQKGVYKQKDSEIFVMLTVVSGDSENIVKNELLATAYKAVEEPDMTNEGFVGEMIASYMKDENFYVFYASSGKTGFVAVAETLEPMKQFLGEAYGEVLFE